MCAHKLLEVVTDALQYPQPVILGQGIEEVLHCAALVRAAGVLFQLGHDLRFVALGQSGCVEDGGEFGVGLEDLVE